MASSVVQIDSNKVTIEGSAEFVAAMQRTVIQALQSAPVKAAPARRGRVAKRAKAAKRAAAKPAAAKRRGAKGGRRGRLPGRTVNGKYYGRGASLPAGYTEVGDKIVPIGAAKATKPARKMTRRKKGAKRAAAKKA